MTLPTLIPAKTSVDNGPALAEYVKYRAQIPPGRYYVTSKVPTLREGAGWIGSGMPSTVRDDTAWDATNCTVIIGIGPNNEAARVGTIEHSSIVMRDIGFQFGYIDEIGRNSAPATRGLGTLFEITNDNNPQAVGHIALERVAFLNSSGGILADDKIRQGHCDHVTLTDVVMDRIDYPITCDENQAVEYNIRNLICKAGGKTAIRARKGGRWKTNMLTMLDGWDSIIDLSAAGSNYATSNAGEFVFDTVWFDALARIKNSVRELDDFEGGKYRVLMDGMAAQDVTIGDPITQPHAVHGPSDIRINIRKIGAADIVWPRN